MIFRMLLSVGILALFTGCASPYVPNEKVLAYMGGMTEEAAVLKLQELMKPSEKAAGLCGMGRAYSNMDIAASDVAKNSDFSLSDKKINFVELRKVVIGSYNSPIAGGGYERIIKYVENPVSNSLQLNRLSVVFIRKADTNSYDCKAIPKKSGIIVSWWPDKIFTKRGVDSGVEIEFKINIAESDLDIFMAAAKKLNPDFSIAKTLL